MPNPMKQLIIPHGLMAVFWALAAVIPAGADTDATAKEGTQQSPSLEMLEFLAEFGDTDDETFDLILHHALRDISQNQEEPNTDEDTPSQSHNQRSTSDGGQ